MPLMLYSPRKTIDPAGRWFFCGKELLEVFVFFIVVSPYRKVAVFTAAFLVLKYHWKGGDFRMAKEENLQPPRNGFTHDEASKGGKKSAEVRSLRAAVRKQLSLKLPKGGLEEVHELLEEMGINKKDRYYADALVAAMIHTALNGNVKAATWIRDTAGEKPTDKKEVEYGERTMSALEGMSLDQKMDMIRDLEAELTCGADGEEQ